MGVALLEVSVNLSSCVRTAVATARVGGCFARCADSKCGLHAHRQHVPSSSEAVCILRVASASELVW